MLEYTDANFAEEVLQSDKPVLVDFSAVWCGPCKQLGPIIEELAREYEGRVKVGKVNIDLNEGLTGTYGIMSVPTVVLFKGGKKVDTVIGLNAKNVYKAKIEGLLR